MDSEPPPANEIPVKYQFYHALGVVQDAKRGDRASGKTQMLFQPFLRGEAQFAAAQLFLKGFQIRALVFIQHH